MAGDTVERWWFTPSRLHVVLCACAMLTLLLFGNPFETQERQWFGQSLRWRFAVGMAPAVDRSIVHLIIDEEDIRGLQSLESEYAAAARIIDEASALGASLIAFDIIFARGNAQVSQPLREAIELHQNVVLAGALSARPGSTQLSMVSRSFPFEDIARQPVGLINLSADSDAVIREYPLVQKTQDGYQPSLALVVYLASLGLDWKKDLSFRPDTGRVEWKELSPSDYVSLFLRHAPIQPVLLNLRCPWSVETDPAAFAYLNLRQLDTLFAKTPTDAPLKPLRNRIVFVSYVATGQGDIGPTVFGPHEPLIYLHSTAVNDLIQSRSLQRTSRVADAALIGFLLFTSFFIRKCTRSISIGAGWLFGLGVIGVCSCGAIWEMNLVPGSVMLAVVWSVLIVVELGRRYAVEFVERLKLHSTMGFYFSPRALERVLQNPGSMEPQEAELTVLLTDLRNSTAIAELLGAHGTFSFLNKIFEAETRVVMAEDGTLEHFLGDQFLSYWGAPDPQPNAPDQAFRAALALIEAMEQLRETWQQDVQALFGYGVALHKGFALIGNKGSKQRLDYGVVGGLINAVARVESLTKYYGAIFLVTREFFNALGRKPEARLIDRVYVLGRNKKGQELELIEVRHNRSSENFIEVANNYSAAFALYQQEKFGEAERLFRTYESDKPSRILADRCKQFAADPPQAWDGIFEHTTK